MLTTRFRAFLRLEETLLGFSASLRSWMAMECNNTLLSFNVKFFIITTRELWSPKFCVMSHCADWIGHGRKCEVSRIWDVEVITLYRMEYCLERVRRSSWIIRVYRSERLQNLVLSQAELIWHVLEFQETTLRVFTYAQEFIVKVLTEEEILIEPYGIFGCWQP